MARRTLKATTLATIVLALASLASVPDARARGISGGDDDEARTTVRCSRGSRAELRVRVRNRELRLELEIDVARPGGPWRVIVLHERRTAFRGVLPARDSDSVRLRRTVPNWFGTESFVVRAAAARGESCRLAAVVA